MRKSAKKPILSMKAILLAGIVTSNLIVISPVFAQDGTNTGQTGEIQKASTRDQDDDIVVTARRREESIDDTPLSVTAFSSASLEKRNTTDLIDVGKIIPNLTVNSFGNGNAAHAGIFIRGIGTQDHWITTDPGVGVYVDGIYLGRQMGANLDLLNIERVEVSRGPQGTLYGRNSLGGTVNFVTRKPSDSFEGKVAFQAGTRDRIAGETYLSGPLANGVSASLGVSYNQRGGVGRFVNVSNERAEVGDSRKFSSRLAVKIEPSDAFSLLLTGDYAKARDGQAPYSIELLVTDPARTAGVTQSSLAPNRDDSASLDRNIEISGFRTYGFSATADLKLSDKLSLKAIGSYRNQNYYGGLDLDSTVTFSFPEIGKADQYSGELQLAGQYDAFGFVAGLYYFHENGYAISDFNFGFPINRPLDTYQTTESLAGYMSGNVHLSDALTLSAGVRYTKDRKQANASVGLFFDPPGDPTRVYGEDSWRAVTWDASLLYALSHDLNAYVEVARGYQNGGFPARAGFNPPTAFVPYNPQYAMNYEAGIKGKIADNVRVAASVFYTKYTDLQLVFNQATTNGFLTITNNAGKSRSYGAELDTTISLNDYFRVTGSVGYLDAKVTQVDPGVVATQVGFRPIFSPKWTVAVTPEVHLPIGDGEVVAALSYSYRSSQFGQSFNTSQNKMPERSLVDFNISYETPRKHWTFSVYGRNIFNKIYPQAITDNSDASGPTFNQILWSNDRSEFGFKIAKSF